MASVQGYSSTYPSILLGLSAAILISISIQYVNEYADYETDALTERPPFSGGSGALQEFGFDRLLALEGAVLLVFAGFLIAVTATLIGYLSIWTLALLGVAVILGWGYSLSPLKLAWRGWGELDNAFLGGLLLPVYGDAVISQRVDFIAISTALPFMMPAFINLLGTHCPDYRIDLSPAKSLGLQSIRETTFTSPLGLSDDCLSSRSGFRLGISLFHPGQNE